VKKRAQLPYLSIHGVGRAEISDRQHKKASLPTSCGLGNSSPQEDVVISSPGKRTISSGVQVTLLWRLSGNIPKKPGPSLHASENELYLVARRNSDVSKMRSPE
jgi:hypothetical protein